MPDYRPAARQATLTGKQLWKLLSEVQVLTFTWPQTVCEEAPPAGRRSVVPEGSLHTHGPNKVGGGGEATLGGGIKEGKQASGRPRANCRENLPLRLRPCWDGGEQLGGLQWEELWVILTGLPLASTEGAAFWTRVHGSPIATCQWRSISLTVCQEQGCTASSTRRRKGGRVRDKERKLSQFWAPPPGVSVWRMRRSYICVMWTARTVCCLSALVTDYPQKSAISQKKIQIKCIFNPLFTAFCKNSPSWFLLHVLKKWLYCLWGWSSIKKICILFFAGDKKNISEQEDCIILYMRTTSLLEVLET